VRGGVTFLLNHGDAAVTIPDVRGVDLRSHAVLDGVTIGARGAVLLREDEERIDRAVG
jgi:hypothetical protein